MGRAEAVASARPTRVGEFKWQNRRKLARIDVRRNHLPVLYHVDLLPVGEDLRDIIRSLVHRIPQLPVAGARLKIHKRASRLKFIILLRIEVERERVCVSVVGGLFKEEST